MNLIVSLALGVLLILSMFFILRRLARQGVMLAALVTATTTIIVYGGLSVVYWPGADVFAIHLAIYLITCYALAIIGAQRREAPGKGGRLHWAPMLLIGFFMFVVLVDAVFIMLAQQGVGDEWAKRILPAPRGGGEVRSVFPGVVSHDFREKENQFNEYQAQRAQQTQRNWQVRIGWDKQAISGQPNRLLLKVTRPDGSALLDARVTGRLLYPADAREDQRFTMQRTTGEMYQAEINPGRAGRWDLVLSIEQGDALHELRAATVINAKPD